MEDIGSMIFSILREVESAGPEECAAYLAGASHDGAYSRLHGTLRISQSTPEWLTVLQAVFRRLGSRSWIYREGARHVWVVESTCRITAPLDIFGPCERAAYARGYFDAEGGLPWRTDRRFYIQLVQKDRRDLEHLRGCLADLGVRCGRIHNPSGRADPEYWRFYVLTSSHRDFIDLVGSWHPHKRGLLGARTSLLYTSLRTCDSALTARAWRSSR